MNEPTFETHLKALIEVPAIAAIDGWMGVYQCHFCGGHAWYKLSGSIGDSERTLDHEIDHLDHCPYAAAKAFLDRNWAGMVPGSVPEVNVDIRPT